MPRNACDKVGCRADGSNSCGRCRSRTYCSVECQRADWKRHKVECPGLAALRVEFEAKHGFPPDSGQHPALTYRRNRVTGKGKDEMRPPASREELEANSQQMMASILVTINLTHPMYVPMASSLAGTMVQCPPWEQAFESEIREMVGDGLSRIDARRFVGYREGEYITLCSELRHKLGVADSNAKVSVGAGGGAVVHGSLLAVPPDAENDELVKDAWLVKLGARYPQLEEAHLPFAKDLSPHGIAAFIASLPCLRELNLVGAHAAVDDTVLDALARSCPALRSLSFGQDNEKLPPEPVSADALVRCAGRCTDLQFLHIANRCASGDPSDANGAIAAGLAGCGFALHVLPGAAQLKKGLEGVFCFWRVEIEQGLISAAWYQRGA